MPRPRNHVPTYRLHKQSGQAVVTINHNGKRREILLRKYGVPDSRSEYQRIHAELITSGTSHVPAYTARTDMTLNETVGALYGLGNHPLRNS